MECDLCAHLFAPVGSAWPNRCGDCIAAEIELKLTRPLLALSDRKPLRRATAAAAAIEADDGQALPDVATPRRRA